MGNTALTPLTATAHLNTKGNRPSPSRHTRIGSDSDTSHMLVANDSQPLHDRETLRPLVLNSARGGVLLEVLREAKEGRSPDGNERAQADQPDCRADRVEVHCIKYACQPPLGRFRRCAALYPPRSPRSVHPTPPIHPRNIAAPSSTTPSLLEY